MSQTYDGQIATAPLGRGGLFTDLPQAETPAQNLVLANNVTFYNSVLEKDYGSRIWNTDPMQAGVVRFTEFFPDNQGREQRIFCFLEDGTLWRLPNNYTQEEVTPEVGAPATLNPNNYSCFVAGGNEETNNPKKLFLYTGYDPVQVVVGDATTRRNITDPAADWTGTNQPFGALLYRGRMFAFGVPNNPHQVYASSAADQENFLTGNLNFNVYPGEGDTIVGGAVFRGRLFMFKYPQGVYWLVDDSLDSSEWYFTKAQDDFGMVSPQGACIANNDLIVANNYGSLTSVQAAFQLGDISVSDLFLQLGVRNFTADQIRPDIIYKRDLIYYAYKGQFMALFQSFMHPYPDRILVVDTAKRNELPKIAWIDKDQPNCLGLVRDTLRVPRPFYGSRDGNLYQMDQQDRWVGYESGDDRRAYEMDAQTPFMDFSQGNDLLGSQTKQFDFLQLEYIPSGDYTVDVDVYVDGRLSGTYPVSLKGRATLDELPLTHAIVEGNYAYSERIPIVCSGSSISLRFRNDRLGENVQLVRWYIFYQITGELERVG